MLQDSNQEYTELKNSSQYIARKDSGFNNNLLKQRPCSASTQQIKDYKFKDYSNIYSSSNFGASSIDERETLLAIKNLITSHQEFTTYFDKLTSMPKETLIMKQTLKRIYQDAKRMKKVIPVFSVKSNRDILIDIMRIVELQMLQDNHQQDNGPPLMKALSQISKLSNPSLQSASFLQPKSSTKTAGFSNLYNASFSEEQKMESDQDSQARLLESGMKDFQNRLDYIQNDFLPTITEYSEEEIQNIVKNNTTMYKDEGLKYTPKSRLLKKSQEAGKYILISLKNGFTSIPTILSSFKAVGYVCVYGISALIFIADVFIIWKLKRQGRILKETMINAIIMKFGKHLISAVASTGGAIIGAIIGSTICPGLGTIVCAIIGAIALGTASELVIEKHIREYLKSEVKPETYTKQYKKALMMLGFAKDDISSKTISAINDERIEKKLKSKLRKLYDPDEECEKKKKENEAKIIQLVVAFEIVNVTREELANSQKAALNEKERIRSEKEIDEKFEQDQLSISNFDVYEDYLASNILLLDK